MSDNRKDFLKRVHDLALEQMPDGATHDEASCDVCKADSAETLNPTGGDAVSDEKKFTEAEVAEQVSAAVKPLENRITELESAKLDSDTKAAVDAAKEEAAAELNTVQAELDKAELAKNEAEKARDEIQAEFDKFKEDIQKEKDEAKANEERASRREERVAKVKEVASFSDDQVEAKADRWADMDDASFEELIEDYKSVAETAAAAKSSSKEEKETESAMATKTETASLGGESSLSAIGDTRRAGYVPGRGY